MPPVLFYPQERAASNPNTLATVVLFKTALSRLLEMNGQGLDKIGLFVKNLQFPLDLTCIGEILTYVRQ